MRLTQDGIVLRAARISTDKFVWDFDTETMKISKVQDVNKDEKETPANVDLGVQPPNNAGTGLKFTKH